jgi:uncharacterized protein YeeX (DUF496 family)
MGTTHSSEFDNPANHKDANGEKNIIITDQSNKTFILHPERPHNVEMVNRAQQTSAELRQKQKENGWSDEYTEKLIVKEITKIIHEVRGKYSEQIEKNCVREGQLEKEIKELEEGIKGGKSWWQVWKDDPAVMQKQLEDKKKELVELQSQGNKYWHERDGSNDNIVDIDSIKNNDLICAEYSFLESYLMHKVGIPNYRVSGTVDFGLDGAKSGYHAFVVSEKTGNIIEGTSEGHSYKRNVNGGDITKGENIIAVGENGSVSVYGTGKNIPGTDDDSLRRNSREAVAEARRFLENNDPAKLAVIPEKGPSSWAPTPEVAWDTSEKIKEREEKAKFDKEVTDRNNEIDDKYEEAVRHSTYSTVIELGDGATNLRNLVQNLNGKLTLEESIQTFAVASMPISSENKAQLAI